MGSDVVRWVHLSDLHMEKGREPEIQHILNLLWRDLDEQIKGLGGPLDLAFFSGDLAKHGFAEEYKAARKRFILPLLKHTGLDASRLFLVPGNHDVSWAGEIDPDYPNALMIDLSGSIKEALKSPAEADKLWDSALAKMHIFTRMAFFDAFAKTPIRKHKLPACSKTHRAPLGDKGRLDIVMLNSAWASGLTRDRASGEPHDRGSLLVTRRQLGTALGALADAELRILVMHHPLDWLEERDQKSVTQQLHGACQIILHGHFHNPNMQNVETAHGQVIVIPAGTLYKGSTFLNGYNLVELDLRTGCGTVVLRRYAPDLDGWVNDTQSTGRRLNGYYPLIVRSLFDKACGGDKTPELHLLEQAYRDTPSNPEKGRQQYWHAYNRLQDAASSGGLRLLARMVRMQSRWLEGAEKLTALAEAAAFLYDKPPEEGLAEVALREWLAAGDLPEQMAFEAHFLLARLLDDEKNEAEALDHFTRVTQLGGGTWFGNQLPEDRTSTVRKIIRAYLQRAYLDRDIEASIADLRRAAQMSAAIEDESLEKYCLSLLAELLEREGDERDQQEADRHRQRRGVVRPARPYVQQEQTWYLTLVQTAPTGRVANIGQMCTFRLRVSEAPVAGSQALVVPDGTLELTAFIEMPGLFLISDRVQTLQIAQELNAQGQVRQTMSRRSLEWQAMPVLSGRQRVSVRVYAGSGGMGGDGIPLSTELVATVPATLDRIPELFDRRQIPDPQPDVLIYVALEETRLGTQVALYLVGHPSAAQRWQEVGRLTLDAADLAGVRQAAVIAATESQVLPPTDVAVSLRAFGVGLYDLLVPEGSSLRALYREVADLAGSSQRPLTWLFIADEQALLPWELVLPYTEQHAEDFLGATFIVAHWVGRQDLVLAGEAPLGKVDFSHYHQRPSAELERWQAAIGGAELVVVEQRAGELDLMSPSSACYGLHVLRYAGRKRSHEIATAPDASIPEDSDPTRALVAYQRRLDFTLRRPVVGLSFVEDWAGCCGPNDRQLRLENDWLMPLLHAGATAVVGPRWQTCAEADRIFFRTFWDAFRQGTALGEAAWQARNAVRQAFLHRADWLAYAYFGHPRCRPYVVRPTKGYAFFEVLDHPVASPLVAGQTYRFRASYRSQATAWYSGRRYATAISRLEVTEPNILVAAMNAPAPVTQPLRPIIGGDGYQCDLALTMPERAMTMPVLVRFQDGERELNTLILNLTVWER
jgi:hypothetical protein